MRPAALAIVVAAALARADEDPVEVGAFAGAHLFSKTNELGSFDDDPKATSPEDAFTFGVRLGFRILPGLRLEGELALMPTTSRSGDADLFVLGWRAHAVFQLLEGRVAPFVLAGVGGSTVSSEKNLVLHEDTDFVPEGGVGARIAVAGSWGFRVDGRILFPPSTSGSGSTLDWEVLGGLYATFAPPPPRKVAAAALKPEVAAPAPPPDSDGDGIPDAVDKCPDQPEDRDGFEDEDGCPDPDNDGDGIPDAVDKCPNEPETKNGYQDDDGCPDEAPVKRFTGRIAGVTFPLGSAAIDESSDWVLDAAVRVLKNNPTLKLEIAGHTDDTGSPDKNRHLAQARADAVRQYLVAKGVEPERLTAVGYGPDQPVDPGRSVSARARNRRVEFKILPE